MRTIKLQENTENDKCVKTDLANTASTALPPIAPPLVFIHRPVLEPRSPAQLCQLARWKCVLGGAPPCRVVCIAQVMSHDYTVPFSFSSPASLEAPWSPLNLLLL